MKRRPWPPPRLSHMDICERNRSKLSPAQHFIRVMLKSIAVICWSKAILISAGAVLLFIILVVRSTFFMAVDLFKNKILIGQGQ